MSSIIHVGKTEELTSLIDRVVTHEASLVYVVLSVESDIAHNIFNLELLKREADAAGKEVIVVSPDARVQGLAAQASFAIRDFVKDNTPVRTVLASRAGTSTSTNRETAPEDGRRLMVDILPPGDPETKPSISEGALKIKHFTPEEQEENIENTPNDDSPTPKRMQDFLGSREDGGRRRLRLGLPLRVSLKTGRAVPSVFKLAGNNAMRVALAAGAIGAFMVLFFVFSQILPRVTVTVTPRTVTDVIDLTLTLDTDLSSADFERGIIPSQILEEREEKEFSFKASGQADVDKRAEGTIRIFNEFSSSPQTLVANTRFLSAEGKLFRTVETIVVPGATIEGGKIIGSTTTVGVQAAEAGDSYNIGPTTFSIPGFKGTEKYLAFYGKNEQAMSGGFQGVRPVITQDDVAKARKHIEEDFAPVVAGRLRNKVPDDLFVLEDSFINEIQNVVFSAEAGEFADSFTVKATARAATFLVEERAIQNAIEHYFRTSSEYSKAFELTGRQDITYIVKDINYTKGTAKVSMTVEQSFSRTIDREALLADILGKNEVEVRRVLSSKEELEKAEVRFWPFWVKSVPSDRQDVTLEVVE